MKEQARTWQAVFNSCSKCRFWRFGCRNP